MVVLTEKKVRERKVPLVFGYGGGVNSLAALVRLSQKRIVPDLILFADTGGEKHGTYRHIRKHVRPWLEEIGFPPLIFVKKESPQTGDKSLEEECLRRETMPSRAFGLSSCAMRWKIEPQEKYLNHWQPARDTWDRGQRPIKILGYDGGEERRASITEDDKLLYWYPLIEWDIDRDACKALILAAGLPIPPKSACFFCPSSTKTEVIELARRSPKLMARAIRIEDVALTSERHDLRTIKGLGRHWAWRDLIKMDEQGRKHLPEAPVEACMVCSDDGCET